MIERSTSKVSVASCVGGWLREFDDVKSRSPLCRPRADPSHRLDLLTGALNRRGLLAVLEQIVADHPFGEEISVLVVDLDRLEAINDSYGYQAGDHVLVTIVDRLRRLVEPEGCVARLAGDEFGCFLRHGTNTSIAVTMAKEILSAIAEPIDVGGATVIMGGLIGIASAPSGALSPERLLISAHFAMNWTKSRGQPAR